jgi:Tfp pilus assembly protein PilF
MLFIKSCAKAYEFIGTIMEKEGSHKEAAENYEKAWKFSYKNQPSIGKKS